MKGNRLGQVPPPPPGFELIPNDDQGIPPPPPGFELVDDDHAERKGAGDKLDAFMRGFADTSSFGLADEFSAGMGAATGVGGEFGDFSGNLDRQRAIDAADEQDRYGYRLAGQIVGGVGNGVAIARQGYSLASNAAKAGKGWMARLMGGAADGGAAAAAYGFGSGDGLADRLSKAGDNAPVGAAFGVAGETLATGAGKLYGKLFRGSDEVAAGVDPAAAVREADQFGIPLSRAQATRSPRQAGIEDQLRSEGRMTDFDARQQGAIRQAGDDMQSRIAPNGPPMPNAASAYEDLPQTLRGRRDALKEASQGRYERTVDDPNILVSGEAVGEIPRFIKNALDGEQIVIDPMHHIGASRAMAFIDDYISRMPKQGGDVKSVAAQLKWVENLRSGLRKNFPSMGADAPALKTIKSALDDWTDDLFDKGLVSGSDDVLNELKAARAGYAEYKAMAEPRAKHGNRLNPRYEAQSRIRSIMDKDMSPEEVGRLLWGASVATPKAAAHMTAKELRDILGADSQQWSAIRQSFWIRATRGGDQEMNPAQIIKNLDGLLKGEGKGVATVLFSEQERQMMAAYTNVMRAIKGSKTGVNPSNTANRLMPTLRKYASNVMGLLAGAGGYAGGLGPLEAVGLASVTSGASGGLGALMRNSQARTASRMPVPVNSNGRGGAALRGSSLPMVTDQQRGRVTVFKR